MKAKAGLALLLSIAAQAHEIGTTRVNVAFHQGRTYEIEIITDAGSLREKLESLGGPAPQTELENRFRRRVNIKFGDTVSTPKIVYKVAAPQATIKLTGEIPRDPGGFTWTYGWTFVTYPLTLRAIDSASPVTEWLEGNQTSKPFKLTSIAAPTRFQIARRYLALGFTHILPNGLDHMLFVLGIYLLSRRKRHVLLQVSAFTIAHSITLGLSMYGIVTVTPKIVEPLIALSIAYVAIENIFLSELKAGRVALVFAFGLLHGMGFAGALKELGLPRSEFLTALLTFNVGVEAGQLAVIAAAFLLLGWHYANRTWYRSRIVIPISAAIACTAIIWTIQRLQASTL